MEFKAYCQQNIVHCALQQSNSFIWTFITLSVFSSLSSLYVPAKKFGLLCMSKYCGAENYLGKKACLRVIVFTARDWCFQSLQRGLWATVGLTNGDEWLEMMAGLNTPPTEWRQEFFSRNITIQNKENDMYIKYIYVLYHLQWQEPLLL